MRHITNLVIVMIAFICLSKMVLIDMISEKQIFVFAMAFTCCLLVNLFERLYKILEKKAGKK